MKWLSIFLVAAFLGTADGTTYGQARVHGLIDLDGPVEEALRPVIGFERHQFSVERVRGKVLINGEPIDSDVVESRQREVLLIEEFDHFNFASTRDFRSWAKLLRGARTYTYDNVLTRNVDGSIHSTPLVLLPQQQRDVADPLWEQWIDAKHAMAEAEQREAAAEQAKADHYRTIQEIAQKQVEASERLAAALDSSSRREDRWLVYLTQEGSSGVITEGTSLGFSGGGIQFSTGRFLVPRNSFPVRVSALNSQAATTNALAQYPGYTLVSVRRLRN